ncbi:MAG: FAD:protein FMN transferase [Planctomycetota bacterium]
MNHGTLTLLRNILLNAWLLGAGVVVTTCYSGELHRYEDSQRHMGTRFVLLFYAPDEELANQGFQAAFARIAQLEATLSDYDRTSELTQLSRAAPTPHPVEVSDDLWAVLQTAGRLSRRTGGAFDVTLGPLTKLWRRTRRRQQPPTPARLRDARAASGHTALILHPKRQAVQLLKPDMRLDLGGIAKGYAVDQALRELKRVGITRALVNASGDMAASGPPPGKPGWLVGVAPLEPDAPSSVFGHLAHQSIATSGDAFQYVEIDRQRYSHILDPNTGLGLQTRGSVSILADDGMQADAIASAVSVMGPDKGLKWVRKQPGIEALVLLKQNGQVITRQTAGFRQWGSARPSQ